jgi:hypothetical protein
MKNISYFIYYVYKLDKLGKEQGINRNTLLKGISISIFENIILIINRFINKHMKKIFHLNLKVLVNVRFSIISKYIS